MEPVSAPAKPPSSSAFPSFGSLPAGDFKLAPSQPLNPVVRISWKWDRSICFILSIPYIIDQIIMLHRRSRNLPRLRQCLGSLPCLSNPPRPSLLQCRFSLLCPSSPPRLSRPPRLQYSLCLSFLVFQYVHALQAPMPPSSTLSFKPAESKAAEGAAPTVPEKVMPDSPRI